jgi:hypothetical protein
MVLPHGVSRGRGSRFFSLVTRVQALASAVDSARASCFRFQVPRRGWEHMASESMTNVTGPVICQIAGLDEGLPLLEAAASALEWHAVQLSQSLDALPTPPDRPSSILSLSKRSDAFDAGRAGCGGRSRYTVYLPLYRPFPTSLVPPSKRHPLCHLSGLSAAI